jgi:anti-sigma regulatory factor (Ser/Thr protein kinase)
MGDGTRAPRAAAHFSLRFPAREWTPALARSLTGWLGRFVGQERLADVQLAVSELVTNSVQHAQLGDDGWIDLTVRMRPRTARVQVADSGPGFRPIRPELPPPDRGRGRGLYLVSRIADRWGYGPDRASAVWFEVDYGAPSS